ncbi:uncharacterized protein LOC142974192 [Anticarsia gemmatalis]|uniref:uncharacterized protein LOC142974192 n=1 Tax=Anticarsia gemmatalis TaxID=129554 RepID=UPI003F7733D9
MYFKIIFFVATFCVVNASVITNNVYDDDDSLIGVGLADYVAIRTDADDLKGVDEPEELFLLDNLDDADLEATDLTFAPKCRPKRCKRLCRVQGKDGSCVDGKCKCVKKEKLSAVNDAVVEVPDVFNSVQIQEEERTEDVDIEATDLAFAQCRPKRCERFCRLLRKSGSCVDGKCKCVKKEVATENLQEINVAELLSEPEELTRNCNHRACDRSCRRRGYRGGGLCINRRCVCRSPPTREDIFLINDAADDVSEELN